MTFIHRIWLGPRSMPENYRSYAIAWENLNDSNILVKDWSWHNLPNDLQNENIIEDLRVKCTKGTSTELPTQIADIVSYELIYRFGGIYANTDIMPIKPINPEMLHKDFATFEEKNYPLIVNAFFGGNIGSPFWKYVIDGIPESYFSQPGEEMVKTTGPIYLTKKYNEYYGIKPIIFPYYTVNPVLWKEVPWGAKASDVISNINDLPEGCIGIHQWGHRETQRSNIVS